MKKKQLLLTLILFPLLSYAQTTRKILMVVSSYGKDAGKTRPGFEFDEYSQAYLIFKANGFEVDVASPKGGAVEPDGYNAKKEYNKAILADAKATGWLKNTLPTASLKAADYAAVYVVGGKGAMFDLPFDPSLQEIITQIYQNKGIISAVCHGPAAFVHVKLPDGKYLVEGKAVTGFCNDEETMFGKKWQKEFPFMLEDKLKARAGIYEKADVMLPHVSISGQLITGQNPYSTNALAEQIVRSLGTEPVSRQHFPDEMSMILVKRALGGEWDQVKNEIKVSKDKLDIELIAVYGYYRSMGANGDKKISKLALDVMELATPYYFNSALQLERATCYRNLDDKPTARKLLEELIAKEPDSDKAKKMLEELNSK